MYAGPWSPDCLVMNTSSPSGEFEMLPCKKRLNFACVINQEGKNFDNNNLRIIYTLGPVKDSAIAAVCVSVHVSTA